MKALRSLLAATVRVRIKRQKDGSASVAELPELVRVEMVSHRAGDVVKPACHNTA